ncbi:hypothetical protein VU01_10207 [Candidatus Electrothrix marina]|uniref:Uncharacterized protein n=1 Tax=Candidatus Electrothrix marina TaxID=1859130 RepID=A0A444JGT2_9BACT|nr:hypothetical protein VU01_10207 [Candidatus Electrothrix marina]
MTSLLEITGDDIAQLRDDDLRNLIGLLCEADYRSAGLPTRGIAWGGHQDAADGGVDVAYWGMLTEEIEPPSSAFVPRKHAVIQVKLPEMSASKIGKEMRPKPKDKILLKKHPKGILKQSIKDLIPHGGAYIIVSAKTDAAGVRLSERIEAMRDAVADDDPDGCLFVNFLDQGQVANWVRNHPALILWVRNKIGRALQGWRSYENWAHARGGIKEEYLLDDGLRLHDRTGTAGNVLSIQDGLLRLRSALSSPCSSVRLVGLSGVGKTRLIQALFDERIGEKQLNSTLAIYADISNSPLPEPGAMAEQLVALQSKVILIIDNCPPDLHRRLTEICTYPKSAVSLLTVEYDVRDDLPEETFVFKLEPASEEVVSKLIRKRFAHISHVDAQTIAEFSGGNARIALALANTVQCDEGLSGFRDNELFERLFWQTDRQKNENLLRSAEVCSLVYSFEGSDTTSEQSELQFLAFFADKSATDLYRDVAELKKRELVQSRSVWRAVLPQAIANWLAKRALASIPKDVLVQKFQGTSERLMKSFSRRLGYLHNCVEAVEIVEAWLEPDGWIGKHVSNLSDSDMAVFVNIAPVAPAKTLAAIERAAQETEEVFVRQQSIFVKLLHKLAYNPKLFERCTHLLCRVVLWERKDEESRNQESRDYLKSLFHLYWSGTHAPVEVRAKIIEGLIDSEDQDKQKLGLHLLEAALEARYFGAVQEFSFGARRRDYGYQPQTHENVTLWFEIFIDICVNLALSNHSLADKAEGTLSGKFEELWVRGGAYDALEKAARKIHAQKPWSEGWLAVRGIIRREKKTFTQESKDRLHSLGKHLEPVDLLEFARTYALSYHFDIYDNRAEEETRTVEIGIKLAQSLDVLNVFLPELVSAEYSRRLEHFGRGLAAGCSDRMELFQKLRSELAKTAHEKRQYAVFHGFLSSCAEHDFEVYDNLLDGIVKDDLMGEWLPILQTTSTIDQRGVERLHQALDIGKARIDDFKCLAYGRVHESISDDDLAELLRKMLSKENGLDVVIEILKMRFFERKRDYSDKLMKLARDTLCNYLFEINNGRKVIHNDYDLTCIASVSLSGPDGTDAAREVIKNLAKKMFDQQINEPDLPTLLNVLAKNHPELFLDFFLGDDQVQKYKKTSLFNDYHGASIDQIPDDVLLLWCAVDPEYRFPLVVAVATCFFSAKSSSKETKKLKWNPVVYTILEQAPNVEDVLKQLEDVIRPMSWSGFSQANVLEQRAALLQEFYEHKNEIVQNWAKKQYATLQKEIRRAKISDQELVEQFRFQDERFE